VIKTLVGQLPALAGTLVPGKDLRVGYFAQQEMDLLQDDDTPLQRLVRWAREVGPDGREQELRDFLGQFRFVGDQVHQTVGTLSGGERARLVLALIVWQRPNLLVLDEPTNHLDLQTREALSIALNGFEGSVLLVSHDRALLREVCDEFWLVAQGRLSPFEGDLDDYQRWLAEQQRATAAALQGRESGSADSAASGATTGNRREDRKLAAAARQERAQRLRPFKKELATVEQRIEALSTDRNVCETALSQPGLSGAEIAELGRKLHALGAALEAQEERWLELSETIQAVESED
jgi:ATP-binding cassette subfamily F protein 3